MQVVILAGGLATRMRPVTTTIPKALLPVAGRPFADLQLEWLATEGITDVVYSIGHLGDQIREHVGTGQRHGLRVRYVDEGEALRGTGGALRLAYDQGALEPVFGVLYGDSYLAVTVREVWNEFVDRRLTALMTVFRNENRFDTSNAQLADGWIVRYDKTAADPASAGLHWIDYGFSMFDRDVLMPLIPRDRVVDLAAVQGRLSEEGRLGGVQVSQRFYEIGTPEGLRALERHLGEA